MTALPLSDVWLPLDRSDRELTSAASLGAVARGAVATFDYDTDGHSKFAPWVRPDLPADFGIGLIVGASGSGKSTLLRTFGAVRQHSWTTEAIADHFTTVDEARTKFYAVGLSSVPTWVKPYAVLSNGEKFRADLARSLGDDAIVDEFTSVVDRNVAQAASRSLRRYVDEGNASRIVLATCHRDIVPDLRPDWIIDTSAGVYAVNPRECLHREPLVVDVYEVDRAMWAHFVDHHYLNGNLHPFARCYIATLRGTPIAFGAAIPFPNGHIRNAWRGHRIVTHPDYQGLGIGPRLADWIAEAHYRSGYNYYAKTTHPRLGCYRDGSSAWQRIGSGKATAAVSFGTRETAWVGSARPSFSHRYVGGFGAEAAS